MSIIESQLVKIEIATVGNSNQSVLRLNYQQQVYKLIRVVASSKLDLADNNTPAQIKQLL